MGWKCGDICNQNSRFIIVRSWRSVGSGKQIPVQNCGRSVGNSDYPFRDVYAASLDIAEQCRQPAFEIAPSRLHEIESKNMIPSIHRLHALALIYRRTMNELLSLYGIEPSDRTQWS